MRWSAVVAFSLSVLVVGVLSSAAATYWQVRFGGEVASRPFLFSLYVVSAIVCLAISYLFALRTGSRPLVAAAIAYLAAQVAAAFSSWLILGKIFVTWFTPIEIAWGMLFMTLGTLLRLAMVKNPSNGVSA